MSTLAPRPRPFSSLALGFLLAAPLAALVLSLPGLLPPTRMNRGVEPAVAAQAYQIYVFERFPHHLNPSKFWDDGFVLPYLLLVVFWLMLWPTTPAAPAHAACGRSPRSAW